MNMFKKFKNKLSLLRLYLLQHFYSLRVYIIGLLVFLVTLFIINMLVSFFPDEISTSFLNPYSPAIKFQLYTFLFYVLIVSIFFFIFRYPKFIWESRYSVWVYFTLISIFILTRVLGFQHNIFCSIHSDWGSFDGFYSYFNMSINGFTISASNSFVVNSFYVIKDCWNNYHPSYVISLYPVTDFVFGITAIIAEKLLSATGYISNARTPYWEFGRFIIPAFNVIYLLLLLFFARRYIFGIKERWPLYLLLLFLFILPLHIYMGSAINYNLLADSLLIAAVLLAFRFSEKWIEFEKDYIMCGYKNLSLGLMKPLIYTALLFSICFGLLLATKWVYHSVVLIITVQYIILLFRTLNFNRKERRFYFFSLSFFVFSMLSCGFVFYLILISRNYLHDPVAFTDYLFSTHINSNLIMLSFFGGFLKRLQILYQVILIPNIGYVNAAAGTFGIVFFTISAIVKRSMKFMMVALWSFFVFAQTYLAYIMIYDPAAMSRNTLLLGLWGVYSVYFLTVLLKWIQRFLHSVRIYNIVKIVFIIIFSIEIFLAGMSYIIFVTHKAPRYQAMEYIRDNIGPQKRIAVMMHQVYPIYPFYPDLINAKTYTVTDTNYGWRYELLKTEEGRKELISKDNADYWVIGSYDACFMINKEKDINNLKNSLSESGFHLVRRIEPDFFKEKSLCDRVYKHYLKRLLHSSKSGGLFSPYYIEIYEKTAGF